MAKFLQRAKLLNGRECMASRNLPFITWRLSRPAVQGRHRRDRVGTKTDEWFKDVHIYIFIKYSFGAPMQKEIESLHYKQAPVIATLVAQLPRLASYGRDVCARFLGGYRFYVVKPLLLFCHALAFQAASDTAARRSTNVATSASNGAWSPTVSRFNPFNGAADLNLLTPSGGSIPVGEVTSGKVVVALLRHLGCPFCWDQAQSLLSVRDQFKAAGFKLAVVAIGNPEGGRKFCSSLPFPPELLLLDPDHTLYKRLQCYEGWDAMMSLGSVEGLKALKLDAFGAVARKYQLIEPKDVDTITVMGGIWVLDDGKVLYGHRDRGVAAHAPMEEVLAACCAASATPALT